MWTTWAIVGLILLMVVSTYNMFPNYKDQKSWRAPYPAQGWLLGTLRVIVICITHASASNACGSDSPKTKCITWFGWCDACSSKCKSLRPVELRDLNVCETPLALLLQTVAALHA